MWTDFKIKKIKRRFQGLGGFGNPSALTATDTAVVTGVAVDVGMDAVVAEENIARKSIGTVCV